MVGVQIKAETAAHNIAPQVSGCACLLNRFLEAFIDLENFAVNIVVARAGAGDIRCNQHAFNDQMGVVLQDVAVLERAGLTLVGIADQVFLTGKLTRHEAPFKPGREPRAATSAQCRLLELGNDGFLRHAACATSAQHLAQGGIAIAFFVIGNPPVAAIESRINLGRNMAIMQAASAAIRGKPRKHFSHTAHDCPPSTALKPSTKSVRR